jgi:hypothetical protein
MKITKSQLKQIIKEELEAVTERCWDGYERVPGTREGQPGSCRKKGSVNEEEKEKSPDDIIARYPDPEGKNPDQVIYRWQQDEFDDRQRAYKAFDKRMRGKKELGEAHGLSKEDADYVKSVADKTDDSELKRILKFIVKSNVKVDKTQDVTKMKKDKKK